MSEPMIVAIDGPSGVGKSTIAKRLAGQLGLPVLDTGAMYRTVALEVLGTETDPDDQEAVRRVAAAADIDLRREADGSLTVLLDGQPVGEAIRSAEVSEITSAIATDPGVRARMVALQREAGHRFGGVVEGRDIGSVVFPDTPYKFFLDATLEERARRRAEQRSGVSGEDDLERVRASLARRDARDSSRSTAPLRCDDTYTRIDTSELGPEVVVARMLAVIRARREADGSA